MDDKLFPTELLEQSIDSRINYFKEYTISHPFFEIAYNDLLEKIYNNTGNSIILVFGPTGAGKSKLIEKVAERIKKDNFALLQKNKGIIPTLRAEAVPPDTGSFDWKDFYYRTLIKANEPLIDYKINNEEHHEIKQKDNNRPALRRSLENVLIYRKPFAFIIDEAQHITMTTSGRNLTNQVNTIKSLANKTGVPLVLTGNYKLITYRDLDGQTIRRGRDVHIQRYHAENENELESFINVLLQFQKHLPLENEPTLLNHWDYFYSRTVGCIGILKDWFYLTYSTKLRSNPNLKTLCIDDFKKYALSSERCLKLLDEAKKGEEKLQNKDESERNLYAGLGLINDGISEKTEDKQDKKTKGGNKNPGQRNPKRDTVGIDDLEEAQ